MKYNWLVTSGKVKIDKDSITYFPEKSKDPVTNIDINTNANIYSDVEFENGSIEYTVKTKDKKALCQLVLNTENTPYLNIGMNTSGSLFGITKYNLENKRWEWINGIGTSDVYIPENEYNYKITVQGSLLTLYINGIELLNTSQDIRKGQIKFYISSEEEVVITNIRIGSLKPKAFIVMQFSEEYNKLYSEVIRPVCENYGLDCERADEFYTSTPILIDIIKSINNSSIIIAEITPDNPNVFYEVGYAHAINKPTILLCDRKKREKLPFDISGFRTLFYEDSIAGKTSIEKNLNKFLKSMV